MLSGGMDSAQHLDCRKPEVVAVCGVLCDVGCDFCRTKVEEEDSKGKGYAERGIRYFSDTCGRFSWISSP